MLDDDEMNDGKCRRAITIADVAGRENDDVDSTINTLAATISGSMNIIIL